MYISPPIFNQMTWYLYRYVVGALMIKMRYHLSNSDYKWLHSKFLKYRTQGKPGNEPEAAHISTNSQPNDMVYEGYFWCSTPQYKKLGPGPAKDLLSSHIYSTMPQGVFRTSHGLAPVAYILIYILLYTVIYSYILISKKSI